MMKSLYHCTSNILGAFIITIAALLLFSFSPKNLIDIRPKEPVNDTIPQPTTTISNQTNNFVSENSQVVKDLGQSPDSSKAHDTIEASYPGGAHGWMNYLIHEFRYPEKAQRERIQGRVIVHFTVDEGGRVSNIEALTGDPVLQKEAKRVIKNSGKWIPASQNGKPVVWTKEQPITFKLEPNETPQETGISSRPVSDSSKNLYTSVEVESSYAGGPGAWLRFLNKNFQYPIEAQRHEIQGTVVVQFIVDEEGNVSDITAVSGPLTGGLREEVVRLLKISGKWTPAIKNGRPVKSYKKQPITFKLQAE